MKKPIGIAVWGVGNHAIKNVLPALADCDKMNLIGLHTRNRNDLITQSELWSCKSYDRYDQMLADDKVEAIYISTPNSVHRDNILDSLKAKKQVLCEKPMTVKYAETMELINYAKSQNLLLMECTVYAHHPQFKVIKDLIENNSIGKLKKISSQFGFPHLNNNDFRYKPELGGGALFDAGFYPISFAVQLMNQPPVNIISNLEFNSPYKVDTGGTAILEFKNGVQAIADWGFGMHYCNEAILWGTKGIAHVERVFTKSDNLKTRIHLDTKVGKEKIIIKPANHFVLMLNQFAKFTQDLANHRRTENLTLAVASTLDNIFSKK